MRGLVLAMVLAPAAIDERLIPVDARAVLDQYLRARAARHAPLDVQALERALRMEGELVRVEPIPLWHGPTPWAFIPPPGASPRPTPTGGTALSLGIVRTVFERPSTDALTLESLDASLPLKK
jgi:hypothetical protein